MRIRMVIDLDYPLMMSEDELVLVKEVLSTRIVKMAKDGEFSLEDSDLGAVGEVMVGCGLIDE